MKYRRSGLTTDELLAEIDMLAGDTPDMIADRLGMTTAAIAQRLYRYGHNTVAARFAAAYKRQQQVRRADTPSLARSRRAA